MLFSVSLCLLLIQISISKAATCVPGEYRFRGECIKCHRNSYSSFANQTRCEPCPEGKISRRGAEAFERCRPCPKGTFFDGSVERAICRRCPSDTYSDKLGLTECIPCPNGSASFEGAKSSEDCITCRLGFAIGLNHFSRPFCVPCYGGGTTFKPNSRHCDLCPVGTFSYKPKHGCRKCRPGTFADRPGSYRCHECPVDTFQNEEKGTSCQKCPEGSSTKGQTGALRCRPDCNPWSPGCTIKSCPPGFELQADGKCKKCSEMYVSSSRSTTPCSRCQSAEDKRANDARTLCVCMPGYTKSDKNRFCRECPKLMSNTDGGKCKCILNMTFKGECRCPPHTVQIGNSCLPCDPRLDPFCENCDPPNFFNRTAFDCQKCPSGTFRTSQNGFCEPCPEGLTSEEGSFRCLCKAGKGLINGKCEMCRPGTFNPQHKDRRRLMCQRCSRGSFQDKYGSKKCKECPRELAPVDSLGSTKCLDPCPPNMRRHFSERCVCIAGFRNIGSLVNYVCVRTT